MISRRLISRFSLSSSTGHRIDLHAQGASGFVHQVNRLIGQKTVGDIAGGKFRRRYNGIIGDADAVMDFVFFLDAPEDRDRVLDLRLRHVDRLEAPFQGRVAFDIFLVFFGRGGADRPQFAARQSRLKHIGRVHRSFRCAGADQRMQLVDKQDDLALLGFDLFQYGFQAVFEFAAEFRAGDNDPRSRLISSLFFRFSGTSPETMRWARPSTIAVLPVPASPIRTGIVLGPAGKNLHDAADLVVAPDHRVELFLPRHFRQVYARIFPIPYIWFPDPGCRSVWEPRRVQPGSSRQCHMLSPV